MRIQQILENSTTSGSVATVAQPMMTQTRENTNVRGLKPVQQVIKGKAAKKGPYANSIVESKVTEDDLAEQDLIVIPGQGRLKRTGFVKHDLDQGEHEGHTLKNSLHTIARAASDLDKRLSVQSEFPEWVSEKIGAAKGMMVSVMDYLISSQEMQHDPDAINELSSDLLQRSAQAATDKRNQAMEPKLHDALGGGYMNPLAKHYDNVSQKMDNRAAQVKRKETIQNIASKIASPAVMRKIGMNEGSQRVDSLVTDALKVMKGPEVSDAVLALKRVLGDRAYNERRGFYSFYVDQIHDMYGQQGVEEGMGGGVDAKGRTQKQWLQLVKSKYPTANIMQAKMIDGPIQVTLPDGKKLRWEKVEQGVAEADMSRRGFLKGLGAAALGATALGAAGEAQANQDQNLGNGFVLTTVDALGGKFKAVLDTQSDIHYLPNRHEGGGAIVRSMAPFITIKNGQINTTMNVGPAVQAALNKAGLLKGVEEGVVESEKDTSRMNKQHQDFYNKNPNFKRDDREATSVGGRLATKVTPKPAQVTKKPMTPFEGKIDFAKKLQGKVDKHNKAVVQTKKDVGSRVADIGAGGKEYNVKTDAAWDAAKKKVSEGYKKK
jgi:hypothetical protein